MNPGFSISHEGGHCLLQGTLDFTTASAALQQTTQLLESQGQLTVNLAGVDNCNSAALALLIELKAVARRTGHQVVFEAIPSGISELARVCQVEKILH